MVPAVPVAAAPRRAMCAFPAKRRVQRDHWNTYWYFFLFRFLWRPAVQYIEYVTATKLSVTLKFLVAFKLDCKSKIIHFDWSKRKKITDRWFIQGGKVFLLLCLPLSSSKMQGVNLTAKFKWKWRI